MTSIRRLLACACVVVLAQVERIEVVHGLGASVMVQNVADRRHQALYGGDSLGWRVIGRLSLRF